MTTEEYKGFTIEIEQDETDGSPREWDNLGTMCLFHRRHSVPNETSLDSADYGSWSELKKAIIKEYNPAVILPVYAYDHSCFDISTQIEPYWFHASWDAGQLGFIFISKEKARQEYGWNRISKARQAQLAEYLKVEVRTYSQWVNGDVWYYSVTDQDGERVDSCGSFYGYDEVKKAAEHAVDFLVNEGE